MSDDVTIQGESVRFPQLPMLVQRLMDRQRHGEGDDAMYSAAIFAPWLVALEDELIRAYKLLSRDPTFTIKDSKIEVDHWACKILAQSFADTLLSTPLGKDIPNFVTMEVAVPDCPMVVTIQKREGKSPATIIGELRAQIAEFEAWKAAEPSEGIRLATSIIEHESRGGSASYWDSTDADDGPHVALRLARIVLAGQSQSSYAPALTRALRRIAELEAAEMKGEPGELYQCHKANGEIAIMLVEQMEKVVELEQWKATEQQAAVAIAATCGNAGCFGSDGGTVSAVKEMAGKLRSQDVRISELEAELAKHQRGEMNAVEGTGI